MKKQSVLCTVFPYQVILSFILFKIDILLFQAVKPWQIIISKWVTDTCK